jgi:hypothetical protein
MSDDDRHVVSVDETVVIWLHDGLDRDNQHDGDTEEHCCHLDDGTVTDVTVNYYSDGTFEGQDTYQPVEAGPAIHEAVEETTGIEWPNGGDD